MSACRRFPRNYLSALEGRRPIVPRRVPHVRPPCRCASTAQPYPKGSTGYRVSTVLTVLMATAVAGTAYALYVFYTSLTTFPQPLRADLRSAIKTRDTNLKLSAQYFQKAWDAAKALDPKDLGTHWPKKLSGIAISLAEVLEKDGNLKESFDVLQSAWKDLDEPSRSLPEMKQRRVAIASKMADLAESWDTAVEEKWAVWALEEILREGSREAGKASGDQQDSDLKLPSWANQAELTSCLQRLGAIYARQGNLEYAVPLYLQALGQLPLTVSATTPDRQATPTSLCQAAVIFNNLSHLFSLKAVPGNDQMKQALAWGHRGIEALKEASQMGIDQADDPEGCRRTAVVSQTSQATLLEMMGDKKSARVFFASAGKLAENLGWKEGMQEAAEGLSRVTRKVSPKPVIKD